MTSYKNSLIILSLLLFLAACNDDGLDGLIMPEVEFEPQPIAELGESVVLEAFVTYDGEPVLDAQEMNFEYWLEDDQEQSKIVDATNNQDGTYTIEVEFEEEGEYWIYAHTTARDIHTMPKRSIKVGAAEVKEKEADIKKDQLTVNLSLPSQAENNKPQTLSSTVENKRGEHVKGASVRYEIKNLANEDIEWVIAKNHKDKHLYDYTFESPGEYEVSAYAEAGSLILDPITKLIKIK